LLVASLADRARLDVNPQLFDDLGAARQCLLPQRPALGSASTLS
jgi:hypothetical protein